MRKLARVRCAMFSAAVISYSALGCLQPARAWSAQGHEYIGNLAWEVLNPRARAEVAALLGPNVTLGEAAVWPDCMRDISGSPTTQFRYLAGRYAPRVCKENFDDDGAEEDRMTDYARRNWTQCVYAGRRAACNLAYHFTNVNIHNRTTYRLGFFGTGPQDVVQAINAAITVLRCPTGGTCATAAPFNIRDKREALFLLAHFVGDVHQPLHAGAVYLDRNGAATGDTGQMTTGGNYLLLASGDSLHSAWDGLPSSLGTSPSRDVVSAACRLAPQPNPAFQRPESWATESVRLARAAYSAITFSSHPTERNRWNILFANEGSYNTDRRSVQDRQLVTSAARLAATLNAVWPSSERSPACAA